MLFKQNITYFINVALIFLGILLYGSVWIIALDLSLITLFYLSISGTCSFFTTTFTFTPSFSTSSFRELNSLSANKVCIGVSSVSKNSILLTT